MSIITPAKVEGPTCRNCGCRQAGDKCRYCGANPGAEPVVQAVVFIERRRPLNAGIRRIYRAMFKSGALRQKV